MTNFYVRSGAAGANNGTSWANAFTSLTSMASNGAGGDSFWVSEDHNETAAAAKSLTFNASNAITAPYKIICVNHNGSVPPSIPTDLRTTGVISTTGNSAIQIGNGPAYAYWYGLTFNCGSGAVGPAMSLGYGSNNTYMYYDTCTFNMTATGSGNAIRCGSQGGSGPSTTRLRNCTVSFGNTGQFFQIGAGPHYWEGVTIGAGVAVPSTLFNEIDQSGEGTAIRFDSCDLSLVTGNLLPALSQGRKYHFVNCKLGSGVTIGSFASNSAEAEANIVISDSGTKSYRQERYKYSGTLTTETVVVRSGGASDGTTPISWKNVTTASVGYVEAFKTFEIAVWNNVTGVSKTATVQLITDNVVLLDNQCWMDVEYLGSASFPQSTLVTTSSNIASAGSNLTTSTATWTTTGLGTPKPQQLSVTFTPNMVGLVRATVYIAKASTTIWVDPVITVV